MSQLKRSTAIAVIIMLLMVLPSQLFAATATKSKEKFVISGKDVSLKNETVTKSGVVYAPAKDLFEKLGYAAKWDAKSQVLTLTKKGQTVQMRNYKKVISINGKNVSIGQLTSISKGVLFVPMQKALEAIGYKVAIDSKNKKYVVSVNKNVTPTVGFLWEANKDGHIIYLLGSIHIGTEDLYPLSAGIEKAFQKSNVLAVEADLLNVNRIRLQQMAFDKAVYKDGSTIKDHIPADLYEQVKEKLDAAQLPIDQLGVFKPWYLGSLLGNLQQQALYPQANSELGIDLYFSKAAKEAKKPIVELEGVEAQFNMLDGLSEELELMMLSSALEEPPTNLNPYETMLLGWKNGNELAITNIMDELNTSEISKEFSRQILDIRNEVMLKKIETYFADNQKTYFVVAGSAHMFGENGLVEMMKQKGFEMTRIMK